MSAYPDLEKGIEAYIKRQNEMLSWMPDWIDQHEFDRQCIMNPMPITYHEGHTIILHWSNPSLDLLQAMIVLGKVERKLENGLMWYKDASK